MDDKNLEFEAYFQQKLQEDREALRNVPYSMDELKQMYRHEFERIKSMPHLELQMEPQPLDYETVNYFLPEKWECHGKVLFFIQMTSC
ncbi:hypothetical protein [Brevibacillus borstelensis]|uniref:hypothetical protein n=1 Tax=Brevibacillus borstelensis TaxID=45462 RepID=UPI00287F8237|nr:hypothetical protein [Brevibacillus borstelensis]WNF05509.1 hypothetical protein RFB14_24800 [Brevibacillus borstelensis]